MGEKGWVWRQLWLDKTDHKYLTLTPSLGKGVIYELSLLWDQFGTKHNFNQKCASMGKSLSWEWEILQNWEHNLLTWRSIAALVIIQSMPIYVISSSSSRPVEKVIQPKRQKKIGKENKFPLSSANQQTPCTLCGWTLTSHSSGGTQCLQAVLNLTA